VFVCSQALGTDDAVTSELFITWDGKIVTANMTLGTSGNRSIDRDYFIKARLCDDAHMKEVKQNIPNNCSVFRCMRLN